MEDAYITSWSRILIQCILKLAKQRNQYNKFIRYLHLASDLGIFLHVYEDICKFDVSIVHVDSIGYQSGIRAPVSGGSGISDNVLPPDKHPTRLCPESSGHRREGVLYLDMIPSHQHWGTTKHFSINHQQSHTSEISHTKHKRLPLIEQPHFM